MPYALLVLDLRVITLVIACLIVVPAFSMSFLERPDVTHTLSADLGCQPPSPNVSMRGAVLNLVMRTPLARDYRHS